MRQASADRALYYRQLRQTVRDVFLPELTSAQAIDAAGLVDRILAEFVVEEEWGQSVSAEFAAPFAEALGADERTGFDELRAQAAAAVAAQPEGERAARLVGLERAFLERVEGLRAVELAGEPTPAAPAGDDGCSVTRDELTAWFRRRLPGSPAVVVEGLTAIPGGRSKETMLVSLSGTTELPAEVILRKDRAIGVLQTRAADEFAVIKAVYDFGGVPIPKPFFADADGELTFEVMERVAGGKAGEFFPDLAAPVGHRSEIGRQLAVALARLHSIPLDRLEGTGFDPASATVTEESVIGAVNGMVARINDLSGPPCVTVPLAQRWLVEHVSDVVPAPRVCLLQGDFGLHNTLIDGPTVTALVDWEGATIGPPTRELAAAWNAVTALMPWPEFAAAYVAAGGAPSDLDPRAIRYYRMFISLGGFMASRTGGHLFRTGAKRDLLTAHSGLDSVFRCSRNLARALDEAMAANL